MKIIFSMAMRNIRQNKKWAMMTVSGIAISVMLIATIVMFAQGTYESGRDEVLGREPKWNVRIESDSAEVPDSEYVIQSFVRTQVGHLVKEIAHSETEFSILHFPVENFKVPEDDRFVTLSRVLKGRRPEKKGEATVGASVADTFPELELGSKLSFVDVNGLEQEIEVVGFLEYSDYIQVYGYDEYTTATTYLQIDPKVPNIETEMMRMFPGTGNQFEYHTIVNQLLGMQDGIHPLITAIILVSAFVIGLISLASIGLIYNSFNLSTESKIKQIGIIQSVGATKRQVSWMVYIEGFVLAFIGITLGIVLGYALAQGISYALTTRFNELSMKDFVFKSVINRLVILIIYGAGFVSVLLPIRKSVKRANKISPIDSLRQTDTFKGKDVKAPKFLNISGQLAYKNIKRNKASHRGTIVSLVITMVVVIAVNTFIGVMSSQVQLQFAENSHDVIVHVNDSAEDIEVMVDLINPMFYQEKSWTATAYGGVDSEDFYSEEIQRMSNEGYYAHVYTTYYYLEDKVYDDIAKDYDLSDGGALVMNHFRGEIYGDSGASTFIDITPLELAVGDVIDIDAQDSNSSVYTLKVGALIDTIPDGLVSHVGGIHISVLMPKSQMMKNEHHMNDRSTFTRVSFKAEDHLTLEKELNKIVKDENLNLFVYNETQSTTLLKAIISSGTLIVYLVAGFIALICISNVINVVVSSLRIRRRENAILQSVGMSHKDLRKMLVYEALMVSWKPLFWGTFFGVGASYIMYLIFKTQIPFMKFTMEPMSVVISWSMVLLVLAVNIDYSLKSLGEVGIIDDLRSDGL